MKKILFYFVASLVVGNAVDASSLVSSAEEQKWIREIKRLHPQIVAVRPSRVEDSAQPKFKVRWTPAIILKSPTSLNEQKLLANKVAEYVVRNQKGVLTEKVYGGILAFIEGKDWYPDIGQVFYKVIRKPEPKVEVWTAVRIQNKNGNPSCCNDSEKIGIIQNDRFVGEDLQPHSL